MQHPRNGWAMPKIRERRNRTPWMSAAEDRPSFGAFAARMRGRSWAVIGKGLASSEQEGTNSQKDAVKERYRVNEAGRFQVLRNARGRKTMGRRQFEKRNGEARTRELLPSGSWRGLNWCCCIRHSCRCCGNGGRCSLCPAVAGKRGRGELSNGRARRCIRPCPIRAWQRGDSSGECLGCSTQTKAAWRDQCTATAARRTCAAHWLRTRCRRCETRCAWRSGTACLRERISSSHLERQTTTAGG